MQTGFGVIAEWAAFDAASAAHFLGELFQSNRITGLGTSASSFRACTAIVAFA
jgi:hypothetical protein